MAEEPVLESHEFGSGIPVLVIHGWQMDGHSEAADFEPIFSSSSGFCRIYVDLPAMGSSPSYDVENLSDIYTYLDRFVTQRFGLTTRFLLVGSSCGAYLARVLAAKRAQQVDGLLLRVPLIQPDNKNRDVDPFQPLVHSSQPLKRALPPGIDEEPLIIQTQAYTTASDTKLTKLYLPAIRRANNKILDAIRNDAQRYQLNDALKESLKQKFLAPTLILTGRHDTVVGYRDSLALTELYPRSTFVVLDRGTHDLPVDQRGVFDALVHDWLSRVQEWRSQPSDEA